MFSFVQLSISFPFRIENSDCCEDGTVQVGAGEVGQEGLVGGQTYGEHQWALRTMPGVASRNSRKSLISAAIENSLRV